MCTTCMDDSPGCAERLEAWSFTSLRQPWPIAANIMCINPQKVSQTWTQDEESSTQLSRTQHRLTSPESSPLDQAEGGDGHARHFKHAAMAQPMQDIVQLGMHHSLRKYAQMTLHRNTVAL